MGPTGTGVQQPKAAKTLVSINVSTIFSIRILFGPDSVTTVCPNCQANIATETKSEVNIIIVVVGVVFAVVNVGLQLGVMVVVIGIALSLSLPFVNAIRSVNANRYNCQYCN